LVLLTGKQEVSRYIMDEKSVRLDLRAWYDPQSRHIKLAGGRLNRFNGQQCPEERSLSSKPVHEAREGAARGWRACPSPGERKIPKGARGEHRPADVIGAAIKVARIASGEEDDEREATASAAAQLGKRTRKPMRRLNPRTLRVA
jgi:hypothetical protein